MSRYRRELIRARVVFDLAAVALIGVAAVLVAGDRPGPAVPLILLGFVCLQTGSDAAHELRRLP